MRFVATVAGVLILILSSGHIPLGPYSNNNVIAMAAAAGNSGGGQGISGRPQKNATVKGSPKANSSINGGQTRGKH